MTCLPPRIAYSKIPGLMVVHDVPVVPVRPLLIIDFILSPLCP